MPSFFDSIEVRSLFLDSVSFQSVNKLAARESDTVA